MVGSVIAVLTMQDTPSLISTAEKIECCPLFCASRSLSDAVEKGASPSDVVLYSSRRVDDFRSKADMAFVVTVRIGFAQGLRPGAWSLAGPSAAVTFYVPCLLRSQVLCSWSTSFRKTFHLPRSLHPSFVSNWRGMID